MNNQKPIHSGNIDQLAAAMGILAATQELVSSPVEGAITEKVSAGQVATYSLALVDEVLEFARELGWKPWKEDVQPDYARTLDEFADILAFLGILIHYMKVKTGASDEDIAKAYAEKTLVNVLRFNGQFEQYKDNGEKAREVLRQFTSLWDSAHS